MKHYPVLLEHFSKLYDRKSWFAREGKNSLRPFAPVGFTLAAAPFPELRRTTRQLAASQQGEIYVVYDIYEGGRTVLRVFTHVFASVEQAREGFFYLLWGAERLKTRDEGVLHVGELSYGLGNYLCFLRNNIVVRIVSSGVDSKGIPEDFARRVDGQIVEGSTNKIISC